MATHRTVFPKTLAACVLCLVSARSLAGLVSFGPADGYVFFGGTVTVDVTYYNAGAGPMPLSGPLPYIAPDSGQWALRSSVGGFFANATDRAVMSSSYGANGPGSYTPTLAGNVSFVPPNAVAAYVVGNHPGGRTGGTSLAVRNDMPTGTGAMQYRYELQSSDLGALPSSITGGLISTEFYFCPNPGSFFVPGLLNKFAMSFVDNSSAAGLVGLEFGYSHNNTVQWRAGGSGAWISTTQVADSADWDGVRVNIDLDDDTFSIDYFDVSASSPQWSALVATTALGRSLANLTRLDWTLQDGVHGGQGGKNFFDDFRFATQNVAEPQTLVLAFVALALAGASNRRARTLLASAVEATHKHNVH